MERILQSSASKADNNNFDDSIVYLGITACMSVLCIGICIVYSLRLLVQRFPKIPRIPDPWIYYLCGIIIAILLQYGGGTNTISMVIEVVDASFPDLFFALLLPPIIFESGYSLQTKEFAATFTPALVYAGPGTLIAAFIIGIIIYLSGQIHMIYEFTFLDSLLLGTMASATDTVSILATMSTTHTSPSHPSTNSNGHQTHSTSAPKIIPRYIYSLVYGESVLNDAIALVLFRTLSGYTKWDVTFLSVLAGCGGFFVVFIGSTFIGIIVASLAALLFKYGKLRSQATVTTTNSGDDNMLATTAAEVERSLYCVIPFLSYMLAEGLELSGVVATLFCGILMGKTAQFNVSKNTRKFAAGLFRMLASLFESLVFVYIGIATTQLSKFGISTFYWSTGIILLISCLIGRAGGISISTWIINRIPTIETIHRASSGIHRSSARTTISSPSPSITSTTVTSPTFLPLMSPPSSSDSRYSRTSETFATRIRHGIRNLPQTIITWWNKPSSNSTAKRITKEQSILLWWCGPRGGISFALAMHAKSYVVLDTTAGDIMPIATLFVAIVSLLLVPPLIFPIAKKLNLLESSLSELSNGNNDVSTDTSVEIKVALLPADHHEEIGISDIVSTGDVDDEATGLIKEETVDKTIIPKETETETIENHTTQPASEISEADGVTETKEIGSATEANHNSRPTIDTDSNSSLLSSSPPTNKNPTETRITTGLRSEEEEESLPSPTAVVIATAAKVADKVNQFTDRAINWLTVPHSDDEDEYNHRE